MVRSRGGRLEGRRDALPEYGSGEGARDIVAAGVPEVLAEVPVPTVFGGQVFGLAELFEDGFGGFDGETEFEAIFDVVFGEGGEAGDGLGGGDGALGRRLRAEFNGGLEWFEWIVS